MRDSWTGTELVKAHCLNHCNTAPWLLPDDDDNNDDDDKNNQISIAPYGRNFRDAE